MSRSLSFLGICVSMNSMIGEAMDIRSYNREAWNREVEGGQSRWT